MQVNFMQQAEAEVLRLTGEWRAGPRVTVVGTPADLPIHAPPDDARGMFHKGNVWLVASTQPAVGLADVVNHEAVAHFGLRQLYGRHWGSFMQAVTGGVRSGDAELLEMRHHVRRAYVNGDGSFALNPIQEADEISAALAENWTRRTSGRVEAPSPLKKQVKAAWGFFARERLYVDRPVSSDELQGALLAAQHRIRHGDAFFGIGFQVRRWYASAMSKPWNPHARPMSLSESEGLLKSEAERLQGWEDLKGESFAIGLFLSFFAFLLCIGTVIWGILAFVIK